MSDVLRQHLPVVILVTLVGIAVTVFALIQVRGAAGSMNVDTFSTIVFLVPCIAMIICSFIIMSTATAIGRQLFVVVTGICFATGIVAMIITSAWFSDATITAQLLANSPEGTTITPPIQNMVVVIRNIAAYIVCPTVGSIAGAWVGSRLHPMTR